MKKRKFAVSDIHACFKTFKALLEKIEFSKADELYLLGDYIDRGPSSKALIDHIIRLQQDGYTVNCLKGNHEEMLLDALEDRQAFSLWHMNGGQETLESFRAKSVFDIPNRYIDWMRSLDYYFETDHYILVHAGLNFNHADPLTDQTAMLWIRRWYTKTDYEWLNERTIIHGHTPTPLSAILDYYNAIENNRYLVIDGGCVYKERGYGDLIAFELGRKELFVQKNIE